jgi:hypothetical protein
MTKGAETSSEQDFDLERFKDELFELIDRYNDAFGENFRLSQGESEDTETPHRNLVKFYADANIPPEQMDAVFQALIEMILSGYNYGDERLKQSALQNKALLLKQMTQARLLRQHPEAQLENYRARVDRALGDLG